MLYLLCPTSVSSRCSIDLVAPVAKEKEKPPSFTMTLDRVKGQMGVAKSGGLRISDYRVFFSTDVWV